MNALDLPDTGHGPIELAALASPAVLMEPARLYATVRDDAGKASPWRFLADLPAGSAVFALAAPGASFLLTARTSAIAPQLGVRGCPTLPPSTSGMRRCCPVPACRAAMARPCRSKPGERRYLAAGSRVTARQIVWLQSRGHRSCVIWRRPKPDASPSCSLLALADQVTAEVTADSEIRGARHGLAGRPVIGWPSARPRRRRRR